MTLHSPILSFVTNSRESAWDDHRDVMEKANKDGER